MLRGTYRVPYYMTHECEMLLKKMLVLNPAKRISLQVKTIILPFYSILFSDRDNLFYIMCVCAHIDIDVYISLIFIN